MPQPDTDDEVIPGEGTRYIGVECATTIRAVKRKWGYEYEGDLSVLNGVAYSIRVDY